MYLIFLLSWTVFENEKIDTRNGLTYLEPDRGFYEFLELYALMLEAFISAIYGKKIGSNQCKP